MEKKNTNNVLVTGGAGYIGSMTAKVLAQNGFAVTIFDNLSTGHKSLARAGELIVGDLNRYADLDSLFKSRHFSAVIHFAALSLVAESVCDPFKYYQNNIYGTLNLLKAMVSAGVKNIVFSSTAAVYGEPEKTPITEEHKKIPINPYGRTKLSIEYMLGDSAKAYGVNYAALRYFNAAGADPESECGEWHDPESHLIPNLLRSAAGLGGGARIFGTDYPTPDGTCIRDYVHVYDLASAHVKAVRYLINGGESQAINLGCNRGTSVKEMYEITCKVTGVAIPMVEEARREGDPAVLVASRDKAKAVLDWQPVYDDPKMMVQHAWKFYQTNGFAPKV